jgi:hypothetical protein
VIGVETCASHESTRHALLSRTPVDGMGASQNSPYYPIETLKLSHPPCTVKVYSIKTIGSMKEHGWPVTGRAVSGKDCGPAAMECRPACLSAVSEATNAVPRGVIGATNVGQPGPWSAGRAFWECRPLQLAEKWSCLLAS